MVSKKSYPALPRMKAHKINSANSPVLLEGNSVANQTIRNVIMTNDVQVTYTTGKPGDKIPWHSHMPELYQILINVEGRCRWHYKDNSGKSKTIDADEGEIVYLPGGAENMVEVIGEGAHAHYGILKRVRVPRLEHLMNETDGQIYDHLNIPAGLEFDNIRDKIVNYTDKALIE